MRCEGIIESGLLHRHEILSLVGAELRLAAADFVGQVAEHQVGLAKNILDYQIFLELFSSFLF